MKKIHIIIFVSLLTYNFAYSNALFKDIGVNVGFNTFRLIGENPSIQPMFPYQGGKINYPGGGLNYIEPGCDISAVLFLDTNNIHRLIVGAEYIGMNAKEVVSVGSYAYYYKYHSVNFISGYLGYHFSFYKAPWQNVRLYSGVELMFNNIIQNRLTDGLKGLPHILPPDTNLFYESERIYNKPNAFRLGSRIRVGFEGRVAENIYIGASGTLGFYNVLGRDDSTGELFNLNYPIIFDKGEALQPFFNFLISFQYRFNDRE